GPRRLPEQDAQQRDVAQDGDLGLTERDGVSHQPADDDRLRIAHHELRLGVALADGAYAEGALGLGDGFGDLLGDLQPDLLGVVDVWGDRDGRADVLAGHVANATREAREPCEARQASALLPALLA